MSLEIRGKKKVAFRSSGMINIGAEGRRPIEDLVISLCYESGKPVTIAGFVRYLVEQYGEEAKKKMLIAFTQNRTI